MLSILIPTYNRADFLTKNLELLSEIIEKGGFKELVTLVISDNCSPDDTFQKISEFQALGKLNIDLYRQSENIGLKSNALFVLERAVTDYVMYLGDDDYISYEYLSECISILKNDVEATFIVPNYIPVSIDNIDLDDSRDSVGPTKKYGRGEKTMLKCAWKAHQMSGLVFKREGLFDSYHKYKVDNIYPYIFFAGMCCLAGNTYQIKYHPVRVVQPVKKKDWNYGKDGLINDFFDNYRGLPISSSLRFRLETSLMFIQYWRLTMYVSKGKKAFWDAAYHIAFAKNASLAFTLCFPIMLVLIQLRRKFEV